MSNTGEVVWEEWSAAWRVSPKVDDNVSSLRRAADRQTLMMRVGVGIEIVLTVAVLAVVWWVVTAERGVSLIGWAVAAGLHSVLVWGFTLWNRIGIWKPLGRSTVDYLRLTRERLRRQRRSGTFTLWLVGVEAVALAGWFFLERRSELKWSWTWVPAVTVTGSAIVWALWVRRRSDRELARLDRVEAGLAAEGVA